MKSNIYLLMVITLSIFSQCSSGKRQMQKGNYDDAVYTSIKRLKQNPDNKKAQDVLLKSYKLAKQNHLNLIDISTKSSDPLKWDNVVRHFQALNGFYYQINSCPGCLRVVPNPAFYQNEEETAKLEATKYHYSEGIRLMGKNSVYDSRAAYNHFVLAKSFSPGYESIDDWLFKSKEAGTIHVLIKVIPMPQNRYAISSDFFSNKIIEYAKGLNYNFVRFYAQNEMITANFTQVISMSFDDFVVGQTYVKETIKELKKDSVKVGEVDGKDGKVPVYGTVTAKYHLFEKSLVSTGLLDYRISNAVDGSLIKQQKFPGTYTWYSNWAYFNGDERALSAEDLKLTKLKELPPPSSQDLFILFTNPMYNQVTNAIRNFYSANQ